MRGPSKGHGEATDPSDKPVFVGTRRGRRVVAALLGLLLVVAVFAGSTVVGAALVSRPPRGGPNLPTPASAGTRVTPFNIDTDQMAPASPSGSAPCKSVEGTVFADLDGNGARSKQAEEGLPDVEVEVVDADGRQISAVTDESGRYRMDLDASSIVRVQFRGVSDQLMATPVGPDAHPWVTFVTGGPVCRVDSAGLYEGWFSEKGIRGTPVREIGDRVWRDDDGDGVQDPNEAGIAGVELELVDSDGVTIATTTTSDSGTYRFAGLSATSDYALRVVSSPSEATGPLGGLEPTGSLAGVSDDGVTIAGSSGWDSDLGASGDQTIVLIPAAEQGASDHSIDLGYRPAT